MSGQGWQVGEIKVATTRGKQIIAGWLNGHFALDFRVFLDSDDRWQRGWTLTHIPSGYVVRRILADLPVAQRYADTLAGMGDWSFSAPDQHERLAPLGKAIKDLAAQFAGVVIIGAVSREIGPSNFPAAPVAA